MKELSCSRSGGLTPPFVSSASEDNCKSWTSLPSMSELFNAVSHLFQYCLRETYRTALRHMAFNLSNIVLKTPAYYCSPLS